MKRWLPILLIILIIAAGLYWRNSHSAVGELTETQEPLKALAQYKDKNNVLLEFTSVNCPYCEKMKPIISELAQRYGKSVKFIIANTGKSDESLNLAHTYHVTGVPTILLLDRAGQEIKRFSGFTEMTVLEPAVKDLSSLK